VAFAVESSNDPTRAPGDKPLTILGASTRAAADSARHAFFAPVAADLFADLDLCELAEVRQVDDYPRGFEAVLREPHGGGWMYCGALENFPDLIERWSGLRPLYGNSAATLRAVRDPWQVAACLTAAGIHCPKLARNGAALPRDGSWLQKPLESAGGQDMILLHENAPPANRSAYFQHRVDGRSYSGSFIAAGGESRLLGITQQRLSPGSFRYCGSIGPVDLPSAERQQFERIGAALSRQFSLVGLFGVDAILADGAVWPVEVNPRYTASMEVLERSLAFSAVACHVAACRDGLLPTEMPGSRGEICGKRIVFAENSVVVRGDLRQKLTGIADVPRLGATISPGSPIFTIIRSGTTPEGVAIALAAEMEAARLVIIQQPGFA
jgi:predicted ATP-grasp superfamily ATP-dependent carboligase